jgi:FkbM family methyltransferase
MLHTIARVKDGLRRRARYSGVRAEPGVVLRELDVAGETLLLGDIAGSVAVEVVAGEVGNGAYDFSDIAFRPGDTVIDLGAHIGVVSIWLAKRYPEIRVLAFEPMPRVFELLTANLRRNRVRNVEAYNLGVSAHGGPLDLVAHFGSNTGGGTSFLSELDIPGHVRVNVETTTLDEIFRRHRVERSPLLKIDIEGGEYDVLEAARLLNRVENIRGEFHENTFIREQGHSMAGLHGYCESVIGEGHVRYTACLMADA